MLQTVTRTKVVSKPTGVQVAQVETEPTREQLKAQIDLLKAQQKELREKQKSMYSDIKTGVSEYKGHLVLTIAMDNGKPFTFGQAKARAIIASISDIKEFSVMDNTGETVTE